MIQIFKSIVKLLIVAITISQISYSQPGKENEIMKAMKDELARSMKSLELGKLKKPYYISYTLADVNYMQIKASLGAMVYSELKPGVNISVDVKVGDYSRDNTNFMDMNSMFDFSMFSDDVNPIDKDYMGIRRALWLSTDSKYKYAAEVYESKVSALKQQKLSPEDSALADYLQMKPTKKVFPEIKTVIDKDKWEKIARHLSATFSNYKDIQSSSMSIYIYNASVYFTNSEGTETRVPLSLAAVRINAMAQADDGEPLYDHLLYYNVTPEELPAQEKMNSDIKEMAENLDKLRNAPAYEDTYSGPILFENQAAYEVYTQKLLAGGTGLISSRKPFYSDTRAAMNLSQVTGESLDSKLDKKIISENFFVSAKPKMKKFGQTSLIGSYEIDAEGVAAPDEVVLVDKGILKTMLSDRVPTQKIKSSNGHSRFIISGESIESSVGPGVIDITYKESVKKDELKKILIEKAKEEGLDYAIIVRKITTTNSGIDRKFDPASIASLISSNDKNAALTNPIYVYKVNLKDGSETLIRSTQIGGLSVNSLKKVIGASSAKGVYNTLMPQNSGGFSGIFTIILGSFSGMIGITGIPASVIGPDGIVINELELKKKQRSISVKLPAVSNPIGRK